MWIEKDVAGDGKTREPQFRLGLLRNKAGIGRQGLSPRLGSITEAKVLWDRTGGLFSSKAICLV